MRKNVCLAVIYGRRLLVIKRRGRWILPRKKTKVGELEIDCIFDRIIKEIPKLRLNDLMPLGKFNGRNFFQWSPIKDKIYIAKVERGFFDNSLESKDNIKWIKNLEGDKISKSTSRIFFILKSEGCL